jgi:NAD(P)H-flavin reductase
MENIFLPKQAFIQDIVDENALIKTFIVSFKDEMYNWSFTYEPGQFMMVSIPHFGEAPFSLSSTPTRPGKLHFTLRNVGKQTGAMFQLKKGDAIGLRGPFGRPFPIDIIAQDVLFIAGGVGMAVLRSAINFTLDQTTDFGRKTIFYGSASPAEVAFHEDIVEWQNRSLVTCMITVEKDEPGWNGLVGNVTSLLDNIENSCVTTGLALICGPPIMIRFALPKLAQLGFSDENVWTTLERHMNCGVGTCGHCHFDDKLICNDGPIFNLAELRGHMKCGSGTCGNCNLHGQTCF